jgi:hypothetical protein
VATINITSSPYSADNTGSTDSYAAWTLANTNLTDGDIIQVPAGSYLINTGTITWAHAITIQCLGAVTIKTSRTGTGQIFSAAASTHLALIGYSLTAQLTFTCTVSPFLQYAVSVPQGAWVTCVYVSTTATWATNAFGTGLLNFNSCALNSVSSQGGGINATDTVFYGQVPGIESSNFTRCLFFAQVGTASGTLNGPVHFVKCIFCSQTGATSGLRAYAQGTAHMGCFFIDCFFANSSGYGLNVSSGALAFCYAINCSGYSNTSGTYAAAIRTINPIASPSTNPFNAQSSSDYRWNAVSTGGLPFRQAGNQIPAITGDAPDLGCVIGLITSTDIANIAAAILVTPSNKIDTDGSGMVYQSFGTNPGQINLNGGNVPIDGTVVLPTSPIAGSVFEALLYADIMVGRRNQAQGGGEDANGYYITLDAGASSIDNFYNGYRIELIGGTGSGQSRSVMQPAAGVLAYSGTTKKCYIDPRGWTTIPDNTTLFAMYAYPTANVGQWGGNLVNPLISGRVDVSVGAMATAALTAIWGVLTSAMTTAGSIGQFLTNLLLTNGAVPITVNVVDSEAHPVGLAQIYVPGAGNASANSSGVAILNLAPGTYSVYVQPTAGIIFAPYPYTLTVVANTPQTITIAGTSALPTPTPPSGAGLCTVSFYGQVSDSSSTGTLTCTNLPASAGGRYFNGIPVPATMAAGLMQWIDVPQGATIVVTIASAGVIEYEIIVPTESYLTLTP